MVPSVKIYNVEQSRPIDPIVSRYRHPWLFYALATAIPWVLWFSAGALSRRPDRTMTLDVAILLLELFGLLAPVITAAVLIVRAGLAQDVARRLTLRGVRPAYGLFALLGMPVALLVATAISLLFGYSPEQFGLRGGFSFSAGLLPTWVPLAMAAILDELAWHCYGTDALAARWSVFRTSMVFAVIWALWHLPLASIRGYYQAEVVETGWLATVNFLGSIFPFVILMNWVYYRSGRSVIVAIVFHLAANFGNEIFMTHPDTKAIQTVVLLVVSVIVLWRERALFFTRPVRVDA